MRYLSLFAGIGGFEIGIQHALSKTKRKQQRRTKKNISSNGEEQLGAQCIGYSEIDKYAIQIYEKHFPTHKAYGDITKIQPNTLPDFDLLVGGFPCQAFSIAGKRRGFDDTRGTLFFDIARILKEKRPRNFILENVKGLLSHDNGRTFKTIISTLAELGYCVEWQVLNAKNFGVPQNRERVFIVGNSRGTPRPKVFPFGENGGKNNELQGHHTSTLTARYEQAQATGSYIGESKLNAQKDLMIRDGRDNRSCLRSGRTPELGAKGTSIRRLTPTECARLQGFPDDWHKVDGISDTQAYKCYGNAVTVNVIQAIIEKLINKP